MIDSGAEKLLIYYGPLAMGWILAIFLLWDAKNDRKRMADLMEKGTAAMVELTTLIRVVLLKGRE